MKLFTFGRPSGQSWARARSFKQSLIAFSGIGWGLSLGATFYPIVGVTSDTAGTDFFPAARLIEGPGVGFDGNAPHGRTSNLTWVTNAPNGGTGDYYAPLPVPGPRLVFDLGESVVLNEISIWGYADGNGNGLISADLRFSDTTTFTSDPISITGITQPVTPRQSFSFPEVTARYVELVPTDNLYGIAPPGGDRVGIGEVAFAIPPEEANLTVISPAILPLEVTGLQTFPLRINNVGRSELSISGVTVTGEDAGAVSIVSFPTAVAAGQTDEIVIEINPAAVGIGVIDATLEIASNDFEDAVTPIVLFTGVPVTFHPITAVLTNTENFYPAENLIAGTGVGFDSLFPHAAPGDNPPASTWVTNNPNGAGDYYDNATPPPVIIFDLGANVPIAQINTWGYQGGNTNGAKDYTLRFATEAEGGNPELGDENFGNSITYQPTFEAAFSPIDRDIEVFEQAVLARYVEMTITDNWRDLQPLPGGDRVGLGEVAFPIYTGPVVQPLTIVSAGRLADGSFSVTFTSIPDGSYELERSTDGENWDPLGVRVTGGPEDTTTILDTSPLPDTEKVVLYRVVAP